MKLGKASGWWVAEFEHGGKRKRKRLLPLSHAEAEAAAALSRFDDAYRAVKTTQSSRTLGELWEAWLAERAKDGFSNDVYNHNWTALKERFAHRTPAQLTRDDWRAHASARFAAGVSPSTVHTELSRLSICLKFAAETGLIEKRPRHWLPSKGKPRNRVLSPFEARALIEGARRGRPHVYLFVILLFATGGRHKAVLDLTWDRVNFERGTIDLEVDLPPDPMHKTWRKGRAHVAMSRMARAALVEAHKSKSCEYVVSHGAGRLVECGDGFRAACERAGLGVYEGEGKARRFVTDVTPHTIRHTVATWARGKVETTFTAQLLGHADEKTPTSIYTHPDAEATREVVDVIDGILIEGPDEV